MNEFADFCQFWNFGNLFLQEIFYRLNVMVGCFFDILDSLGIVDREIFNNSVKKIGSLGGKCGNFRDAFASGQFLKLGYFNLNTVFKQTVFGKNISQCVAFAAVTAINR